MDWVADSLPVFVFIAGLVRHERTSPGQLLENAVRARILQATLDRPGLVLADLRRSVGCSPGTIQHHLQLLQRSGLLESAVIGRRRHLFPRGLHPDLRRCLVVLARRSRAVPLLQAVRQEPGIAISQAAKAVALSRKAMRSHLADLRGCGLIETARQGRDQVCRPTPQLEQLWALLSFPTVPVKVQGKPLDEVGARTELEIPLNTK